MHGRTGHLHILHLFHMVFKNPTMNPALRNYIIFHHSV